DKARQRVNEARANLKGKRAALAVAVTNWQALFPPPSQRELIAAVAATQAERERVALQTINAEPPSFLDAVLRGGARGSSADRGYGRPRPGLRHPGKALPSQR